MEYMTLADANEHGEDELKQNLSSLSRINVNKYINRECLCCQEIDDTKSKNLSDSKINLFSLIVWKWGFVCTC